MSNIVTPQAARRFLDAYMVAALWSEVDSEGVPLDDGRDAGDIAPATRIRMQEDCTLFLARSASIFEDMGDDMWAQRQAADGHFYDLWELAGHDFWLTRNGHGAGFWDKPEIWGAGAAVSLTANAKNFGQAYLEAGDDGQIHQMGVK